MRLYDTHCHLQARILAAQGEAVFDRFRSAGVTGCCVMATAPDDWAEVAALALRPEVLPAFGVHPWYLPHEGPEVWLPALERTLAAHPEAWVGEIGLDRTAGPELALQEAAFEPQLALAGRLRRVASLHCRRTWDRLGWYLSRRRAADVPVVLHSFGGSVAVARQALDWNAYISFSGSLTRTRNERLPEVVKFLPRDRVLIETDSPDLLPQDLWRADPERPNEPAHLPHVVSRLAALWGLSEAETADQLEANTQALVGLYFRKGSY